MRGYIRQKPDKYYHFGFVSHPAFGESEFVAITRPWEVLGQSEEEDAKKGDYTEVIVRKLGILAGKDLEEALSHIDRLVAAHQHRNLPFHDHSEPYEEYRKAFIEQLQTSTNLSVKAVEERKKCVCNGTGENPETRRMCECVRKSWTKTPG